jgi:segregation and condensation protein B
MTLPAVSGSISPTFLNYRPSMNMTPEQLQNIVESALMVAGRPLPIAHIQRLFDEADQPTTAEIQTAIKALRERYANSGIELREVASGHQFQAKTDLSPWLSKLWEERPPRYSRAFLETLALIAYRQPITRAEIEEIRGVTVNSQIIKTLLEREWIRIIGYRETVGKPALFGTTKTFLDHFNLKSLDELPTLTELKNLEDQEAKLQVQLELPQPEENQGEKISTETSESPEEIISTETIENQEEMISTETLENHEEMISNETSENHEERLSTQTSENHEERLSTQTSENHEERLSTQTSENNEERLLTESSEIHNEVISTEQSENHAEGISSEESEHPE